MQRVFWLRCESSCWLSECCVNGSRAEQSLDMAGDATVAGLLARFELSNCAVAVNQEYVASSYKLHDGDEVALLPPVSGGSGSDRILLVRQPIVTADLLCDFAAGADGAIVTFEGIVRDNTRGRRTLYLDYEAYEEMAIKQMHELAAAALRDHGVRNVLLVHRLGCVEIGEASVVIAAASAHRAQAFAACRWLIDTLKQTVPIWKKEHFEDGAVWADGEPFPEAVWP